LCIVVSLSVLIFNAILKCLPDDVSPRIGNDSVDDRRIEAKLALKAAAGGAVMADGKGVAQ